MKTETKQTILRFLRATKLLAVVDKCLFIKDIITNSKDNTKFMKEHPGFQYPPYELAYDAYNHCGIRLYYEGGLEQASFYVNAIRKFKKEPGLVICEWGCGPARIIRHLKSLDGGITKLIGTDYNKETITWCRRNFPDILFVHNQLSPPFPLEQDSIDVLYCWSVFTHLSKPMHHAWIEDIMRVLKPGGLFIGSFHGDIVKYQLLPDELDQYMKGELVVRSKVKEGSKHFTAFHSDDFVKKQLLKKFDNVTKLENTFTFTQFGVLLFRFNDFFAISKLILC